MKLAEALQERADLNKRIAQLEERLWDNALVQDGDEPAEDPKELLAETDRCLKRLETLTAQINRTNCAVQVDGMSLTQLIARKDVLAQQQDIYRKVVHCATDIRRRVTRSEIRIVSTVDVRGLQKRADDIAKEQRQLDSKLQAMNWNTELIED